MPTEPHVPSYQRWSEAATYPRDGYLCAVVAGAAPWRIRGDVTAVPSSCDSGFGPVGSDSGLALILILSRRNGRAGMVAM